MAAIVESSESAPMVRGTPSSIAALGRIMVSTILVYPIARSTATRGTATTLSGTARGEITPK